MTGIALVIISPLKGFTSPSGKVVLTEKFVDGMKLYGKLWNGPILHLCEPADQPSDNLDNIEVAARNGDFDTICAPMTNDMLRRSIPKRSLVLTSVGEQFNSVSAICKELGVPCVYVTEYNLRTRHQIVREYQRSFAHGAWGIFKQTKQESAQRQAIAMADGVQCNGLPTYLDYKDLTPRAHLFFDTRTDGSMLSDADRIARKSSELRQGRKLHLVFSGRINLMKGVDDLIKVARSLRGLIGDQFHMSICGDGEYAAQLRKEITTEGPADLITMKGSLDFKTELVPFVTNEADIFVCCHRQGDPSCTYLETMACGVPVVGYDNDAWRELSLFSKSGRATPLGNPSLVARAIADLYAAPDSLEAESRQSLDFAREHTFEKTFKRRIDHLREIASSYRI
jgi:glycosyltransferase involved in cell wall biosynthesis